MISIAMATYNGAKYIKEQIESILAQTIQNFELVVCDDNSIDNTFPILQEYAARDNRIHVYKNDTNMGFKRNFEKVIGLTHGDYIALCDQDDIWTPDHLSVLYSNLVGCGKSCDMVCGASELIDNEGRELGLSLAWIEAYDRIEETDNAKIAYTLLFFRNPFQGASMMMRREFINQALPIPDDVFFHDTWLSTLACFRGRMQYINRTVNQYRYHNNNVSGLNVDRKNKFGTFILHILKTCNPDRLAMTEALIERTTELEQEKRLLLRKSLNYHNRKKHTWGRLRNALFEMRHYRLIYSCRGLFVI